MSAQPIGRIRQAWYRWKMLRLPWRKRFLVGLDLQGNTYWEFVDKLATQPGRMRRLVKYSSRVHFSEVKVPPQWHQWLRHTRHEPPTLSEQSQDVVRQQRLKALAAAADARWAAKPKYIEDPVRATEQIVGDVEAPQDAPFEQTLAGEQSQKAQTQTQEQASPVERAENEKKRLRPGKAAKPTEKYDPWKQAAASGPGETWQPEAWTPTSKGR